MGEMAGLTSQDVLLVWHSPNERWRLFLHCEIFLRELQTKKVELDALEVGDGKRTRFWAALLAISIRGIRRPSVGVQCRG